MASWKQKNEDVYKRKLIMNSLGCMNIRVISKPFLVQSNELVFQNELKSLGGDPYVLQIAALEYITRLMYTYKMSQNNIYGQ
jgi:hypothetical protein